jgi:hypothetical protein
MADLVSTGFPLDFRENLKSARPAVSEQLHQTSPLAHFYSLSEVGEFGEFDSGFASRMNSKMAAKLCDVASTF